MFDDRSPWLDRFGPLLALSVATVSMLSLVEVFGGAQSDLRELGATATGVLTGTTLILALRAAGISRRWQRLADVLFAVSVLVGLTRLTISLAGADTAALDTDAPSAIWVAIALVTPLAVVRRLLRHRRVTRATMFGAITGYLLIALAFCYVMLYVGARRPDGFFAAEPDAPQTSYMYFSLTTITTLGYGDLAPVGRLGRLLATSEAVIGQVYLVTFVAMLVGLLIADRQRDQGGANR